MVSVIIPVYNVEKYLRECLDSVLAQTCTDLEIILVDDGSTDRSGSICDEYASADERFRVIHKPNGGQAEARNTGLDKARGEYVYFIDSDDYICPETIMSALECAERENADIVYFDAETVYEDFVDSDYTEVLKKQHCYRPAKGARIYAAHCRYGEAFSCLCLNLFRREIIEKNNIRFVKLPLCEDELFTPIVYLNAQKAVQLKKTLYYRRLRAGSVMSGKDTPERAASLAACISGYIAELGKYSPGSDERRLLLMRINSNINTMTYTYARLDRQGRKRTLPMLKAVSEAVSDIHCRPERSTKLRLDHPRLYYIARTAYQPFKKLRQNSDEMR